MAEPHAFRVIEQRPPRQPYSEFSGPDRDSALYSYPPAAQSDVIPAGVSEYKDRPNGAKLIFFSIDVPVDVAVEIFKDGSDTPFFRTSGNISGGIPLAQDKRGGITFQDVRVVFTNGGIAAAGRIDLVFL